MDGMDEEMLVHCQDVAEEEEGSEIDPLSDPEERRVLFAALDSFRYVITFRCSPFYNIRIRSYRFVREIETKTKTQRKNAF